MSETGAIDVPEEEHQITARPKKMGSMSEVEHIIDLIAASGSEEEQNDILYMRVDASRRLKTEEHQQMKLGKVSIPVTISGANKISSEVISTEFEFRILDE